VILTGPPPISAADQEAFRPEAEEAVARTIGSILSRPHKPIAEAFSALISFRPVGATAVPDDAIKGGFTKDQALHLLAGSRVLSVKDNGKEPNQWQVMHFADIGTGEEFVEVFSGELPELLDASDIHGNKLQGTKDAIMDILMEGLMPAFNHLRSIRRSTVFPLPELDRRSLYENFARVLWHAYKDLMPKAAKLLGFDLGFLFQKDTAFEKGLAEFTGKYPSLIMDVPELLKRQRLNWQQGLSEFRNDYLEHRKQDISAFAAYYRPETAEMLFEHAWRAVAEILPVFIEARFPSTWSIQEIPVAERDPKRGRRFQYFQCAPVARGNFPDEATADKP
jgi:hypothetical protein